MKHVANSRPSVPHSTEPPPRLILVVPGRWEQFWQWADTRREEGRLQIRSTNRAAGSFVTLEGTRYQCVTRFEQTRGYSRDTPVIKVGTWWNHDWIYQLPNYFDTVTEEQF
jgi:hypothetical protein